MQGLVKFMFVIQDICIEMADTETQEIVVDFGKICRLCLSEDGVLISLYSTESSVENRVQSIPEKILDLMAIKVSQDDGFPSWICHNCLSQVDKCYEFFDMCRSSQSTLNESFIKALSDAGVKVSDLKNWTNERSTENLPNFTEDEKHGNGGDSADSREVDFTNGIKEECGSDSEESAEEKTVDYEEVEEGDLKDRYFCRDCAKLYINLNEFLVHRISVHHDDLVTETTKLDHTGDKVTGLWTCDTCGSKFRSRIAIATHLRLKHNVIEEDPTVGFSKLVFCKYCGSSYSKKQVLRHLHNVHRLIKNLDFEQDDVDSLDCKICFRPFTRQSSLRNHIEKYHSENLEVIAEAENYDIVWKCGECETLFSDEVLLMQHYGDKHSKYPLEIDSLRILKSKNLICHCGVITCNSFDAFIHDVFYHKKEGEKCPYECRACYDGFASLTDLKKHLISFHWFVSASYDNECTFCSSEFTSNESLRVHLHNEHEIQFTNVPCEKEHSVQDVKEQVTKVSSLHVCDSCGDCYYNEEALQSHTKECKTSYDCTVCCKTFKSSTTLKRHILEYHNNAMPIKCPLCPKVFPRKMNLHNHYKRRHLKQAKKFVCSYCGLSLKGKVALRSHEDRLHRNIRSYKCTECPEAFTTKSILRKHAQRHLAVRPMLQCQYCDRKFSTISGIERHVKTHGGVKDFVCDIPLCGKSFYTKSELKRHIKFHTKDFRHICPVCGHKFMSPGELKKHSTKHTGERPFKCHLCSCAYSRRDDKVKHLRRVHNLKVKRIYGKPFRKPFPDDNDDAVDTIVVDDCSTVVTSSSEIVYSNISVSE